MENFGDLMHQGKATIKLNPITQGYSVLLWKDQFEEDFSDKIVIYTYNDQEYVLNTNKFNENILNALLDHKITEEDLKMGIISIR